LLEKINNYLKTSSFSLPLTIILNFSPLPPLTTILFLSKLGVLDSFPEKVADPDELKDAGFAPEMVDLYREALNSQRTGRREGLQNILEKHLRELRSTLDLMDYNVSTMIEVLSLLTIVVPTMIVSVVAFLSPSEVVNVLIASSAISIALALFMSFYTIPSELWLRRPRMVSLAPMILLVPLFLLLNDVALALMLSAIPSAILTARDATRNFKVFEEAAQLAEKASHSRNPVLAGINLDDLLSNRFYGVARGVTVTLYVLYTYSGSKFQEAVTRLMTFAREYVSSFKSQRRRALQSLAYALVMSALASASMAMIVASIQFIADMNIPGGYGVNLPGEEDLDALNGAMPIYIELIALTYAVGMASFREGNPLYFPIYLLPSLALSYASYHLTLAYAPIMLGWGG